MSNTPPALEEIESRLRAHSAGNGFNAWLKVDLIRVARGEIDIAIGLRPELLQHHGFAHGGVVGALGDTACSWATATIARDVVTATYTIQFLAPAIGTGLLAKAVVIKSGKRQSSVEAKIYATSDDAPDRLAAVMLASIAHVG